MRVAASLLLLCACHAPQQVDPLTDAQASPQANAVPAPIASEQTQPTSTSPSLDAGPPPSPMRADEAIERDVVPVFARDAQAPLLTSLTATLRPLDPPASPKAPEIGQAALDAAKKRLDPRLTVDLGPSRMRLQIAGGAWLVPDGWELRAKADHYGHVLVSADQATYRVLAPGALRALFGERRLDVSPAAVAEVSPKGEGARRLGYKTRRVDVASRSAKASFELARVEGTGDAGQLLVRALLDLMSAPPSTQVAQVDEVPLHAELRWTTRGGVAFEAQTLTRRGDISVASLATPPPSAVFTSEPLPQKASEIFLTPAELGALHTQAVDVGPSPLPPGDAHATISLGNATDELRVVWVDGVVACWLAPRARVDLAGLMRGRYAVEWRSYWGDLVDPPLTLTAPGASEIGAADAGSK